MLVLERGTVFLLLVLVGFCTGKSLHGIVHDRFLVSVATPPPCISNSSQLQYINGYISSTQTFLFCAENIPDAGMLPSYYNNAYNYIVTFSAALTLANLISVDEVQGTATISFSLGVSWTDNRFAMPEFWDQIAPTSIIDLTSVLQTSPGIFFIPNLRFPDATDVSVTITDLTLSNSNMFVLKQAIVVTLVEPGFSFKSYPDDTQCIKINFYVYPYPATQVNMELFKEGVYEQLDINGVGTFSRNPMWNYQHSTANVYNSEGSSSATSIWQGQIFMKRKGTGIVLRLLVPLFLLILLSGVTFWMSKEKRIDVTITILLSVSALYIVILNNIPLVGYLTDLDKFVFWMFLMLVLVAIVHQSQATLAEKQEDWPLRKLYMRMLEAAGRSFLIPTVVVYFINQIPVNAETPEKQSWIWIAICTFILIAFRELFGVWKTWKLSLQGIVNKMNNPHTTMKDLSWVELFVVNAWKFKILSISPSYSAKYIDEKGKIDIEFSTTVELKNWSILSGMLRSTAGPSRSIPTLHTSVVSGSFALGTTPDMESGIMLNSFQQKVVVESEDAVINPIPVNYSPTSKIHNDAANITKNSFGTSLYIDSDDEN